MKIFKITTLIAALSTCFFIQNSNSCTDFRLVAHDGSVLITRSMEFAPDMKANLRSSTRGRVFNTTSTDGSVGLSWKAKYGYIFLDGFNIDVVVDGMNEKGLSFEALYLPNYAKYQTIQPGQNAKSLPYIKMGDWILGNFQTVEEVRNALPNILVFAQKIQGMGDFIFPLHFAVYEPSGKGIIIEYIDGQLHLYENIIGVMTNSPDYDWHLKNLLNYTHLTPVNPPTVVDNGMTFAATGQGFGMMGLPGDVSPPSRFVKTTVLTRVAIPGINTADSLNLAQHIINNVDIPKGLVREPDNGNKPTNESTQWVVFKDLTHKVLYYRTYGNMSLHAVDMSKIDYSENAKRLLMPIADKDSITDMTNTLNHSIQPVAAPMVIKK